MKLSLALWILAVASSAVACYLWRQLRRQARDLAKAQEQLDELAALLALEHDTNYRMACKMYGRAAVDRAIAKAHGRGVS